MDSGRAVALTRKPTASAAPTSTYTSRLTRKRIITPFLAALGVTGADPATAALAIPPSASTKARSCSRLHCVIVR